MSKQAPITILVLEQIGLEVLQHLEGVTPLLVQPGADLPDGGAAAEILVVGPAERPAEVQAALELIKILPNLKLLQTLGQGDEQWDGLLPARLSVATARGAHGGSTAEWAVMALLAQLRDLPTYLNNQTRHTWTGQRGKTLIGARVLVYGASDLGRNIQSRLQPFGATVQLVGTHSREGVIDQITARAKLPSADVVIMALPLTAETTQLVNADFLSRLPDDAIVINPGRGGLIDQAALISELQSGRLRAAIDVATPEPLPQESPLWDTPGLIITPHVGGNTTGADDRAWTMAASSIKTYLDAQRSS